MKKMGLYLDATPTCGGTYQYNQLILAAALTCQIPLCVIYRGQHWQHQMPAQIDSIEMHPSRMWKWFIGLWRRLKLPVSWWQKTFGRFHPISRLIKQKACDIWIFPSQDPFYWYTQNAISVVHDLMHRYERQFEEVGNPAEFQRREYHYQQTARFSRLILVDSELGKVHLEDSYPRAKGKGRVLPYIAARDLRTRVPNETRLASYQLPQKYFFYPAQFWAHKNHVRLLKALARVRDQHPDVQLVLVGSPKNGFDAVTQTINQLNLQQHVRILGYVPDEDMPALYQRARALVMPTFFGPTNIPPLEAMALQCPVIISGIYGMPAQLGSAACYINPNDEADMADKMLQIWVDDALCNHYIAQGIAHQQRWHYDAFCVHFRQILEECDHEN